MLCLQDNICLGRLGAFSLLSYGLLPHPHTPIPLTVATSHSQEIHKINIELGIRNFAELIPSVPGQAFRRGTLGTRDPPFPVITPPPPPHRPPTLRLLVDTRLRLAVGTRHLSPRPFLPPLSPCSLSARAKPSRDPILFAILSFSSYWIFFSSTSLCFSLFLSFHFPLVPLGVQWMILKQSFQ